MKDERPDRKIDEGDWSAPEAVRTGTEPLLGEGDEEYMLNDIGLALRLHGEWH